MGTDIKGILFGSLSGLLTSLPLIIVWIVGIIIAIIRWKKNPRRSLFALLAFAIMLGIHIFSVVFSNSFYLLAANNGMDYKAIGTVSVIVSIITGLFSAVAWIMAVLAIFGKSKAADAIE